MYVKLMDKLQHSTAHETEGQGSRSVHLNQALMLHIQIIDLHDHMRPASAVLQPI